MVSAQHDIIAAQHDIIAAQHDIISAQHVIMSAQHDIKSAQHDIISVPTPPCTVYNTAHSSSFLYPSIQGLKHIPSPLLSSIPSSFHSVQGLGLSSSWSFFPLSLLLVLLPLSKFPP
jgi:hypothetical protein